MECLSYCIAHAIDLSRLDTYIRANEPECHIFRSRDVLKLSLFGNENYLLYIFKNGTVVSWGIKRYQTEVWLNKIRIFSERPVPFQVRDEFSYRLAQKTAIEPHDFFDVDCIALEDNSGELKLSLSYGFSQSVKLQYFETVIEGLIEKYTPLIRQLSNKGVMPLSRRQIRKVIGELLDAKSEMNLISNFLYHPKFFWQHPTLEEYFIMLERYLHIQRRVNAINHRLDTLNEIFDMFNGYLENRHSHHLEIIIIVLITIEITVAALNIHL